MGLTFDGGKNPDRALMARQGELYPDFKAYRKTVLTRAKQMEYEFKVKTTEGVMTGKAGDYIAIGPHGEMYPIDQHVFNDSYEEC